MVCAECIYYDLSKEMVCQNNELSKEMKREMISQYGEKCPFCKVEKSTGIKSSSEGWGFPDKTDSPELGFLTKSQFYSKSHNSRFFKPPFALNSFV